MSKINDLVKELCPNGVKFFQIKEIAKVTIGEFVHKSKQSDDGLYPVYNGGTSNTGFYDEYNNEGHKVIISARGANAGFVNRVNEKFWAGNSCYTLTIINESQIEWNYLYHYLKNNQNVLLGVQQTGSIPAISKKQVEDFKIAIPPLELQEEIVKILDKFGELESELESELEARKNQYEFWRESLLYINCKFKKLEEVSIKISDGSHNPPKGENYKTNYPMISAKNMNNGYYDLKDVRYLSTENYFKENKRTNAEKDDVLLSIVGSVGKVLVKSDNNPVVFQRSICIIKPNHDIINSRYLRYLLESKKYQNILNINSNGAVQKGIYLNQIKKLIIPVPFLEVQNKIVNILDKFDRLVNDITVGLPAEIELRRKQYEYYRNKLLSFEELKVNE